MTAARRTRSTLAGAPSGLILVAAVSLLVSGCSPSLEMASPVPTATPTQVAPIFASDKDALAAATEAYEKYAAASDLIAIEGGVASERIEEFVSPSWAAKEMESFKRLQDSGNKLIGRTTFDRMQIQKSELGDSDLRTMLVYLCVNVSETDIVDPAGDSVISSTRVTRAPMRVTFVAPNPGSSKLLIDGSEPWPGTNFC